MSKTYQEYSPIEEHALRAPLAKGVRWGFIGGLAGTMAMDIILMGTLLAARLPALLCFSIVGDTVSQFFSIAGMQIASGVPVGIATHYLVGPLIGAIFGAIVAQIPALRAGTLKKSVILAVLYVEILSQPLLATTPILLKMTAAETLQWYLGSTPMHLVVGVALGVIVYRGLRPAKTTSHKRLSTHPSFIGQCKS